MRRYDLLVNGPNEETEYLMTVTDAVHQDGAVETSVEGRTGISATWMAVVLLAVLSALAAVGVVRLGQLIDRTDSLIVEQQRTACYGRLQWLADPVLDHPEGDAFRVGASRSCEGDTPSIAFEDD